MKLPLSWSLSLAAVFVLSGCTIASAGSSTPYDSSHYWSRGSHAHQPPAPREAGGGPARVPARPRPGQWSPPPPPRDRPPAATPPAQGERPTPAPPLKGGHAPPKRPPPDRGKKPGKGSQGPKPNQSAMACVAAVKAAQAGQCDVARELLEQCTGNQSRAAAKNVARHCAPR